MKKTRTKQFNYNLNVSPDDSLDSQESLKQYQASVDYWASGFNYDTPEIIDPSVFHTSIKVYRNPGDVSILLFDDNGSVISNGKDFLFENASQTEPLFLTFDVSSNAKYFDASVEYLSDAENGYWVGPNMVNQQDNNTDIWKPKDPNIAVPVIGTQMLWANIDPEKYEDNVVFKDEDGTTIGTFSRLYTNPGKVHVMIYPRDYTGIKVRRVKINFESYFYFVDNFSLHDDPEAQKLYKSKANAFITVSQAGIPVIINVTADPDFNKNAMEYFTDKNGDLIPMVGHTIEINSTYPSYMSGDAPYQYIGFVCSTNSAIKSISILDEGQNPVEPEIAQIYGSDDNPFDGFVPSPEEVVCKFYAKIKKYEIPVGDTSDEDLTKPIVYIIKIVLDDGSNTNFTITLYQYGFLADKDAEVYHYYDPNQTNLTDEEKEHTSISTRLRTSGMYPDEGLKFPLYLQI